VHDLKCILKPCDGTLLQRHRLDTIVDVDRYHRVLPRWLAKVLSDLVPLCITAEPADNQEPWVWLVVIGSRHADATECLTGMTFSKPPFELTPVVTRDHRAVLPVQHHGHHPEGTPLKENSSLVADVDRQDPAHDVASLAENTAIALVRAFHGVTAWISKRDTLL